MKVVAVSGKPSAAWDRLSEQIENLGIALSRVDTEEDLSPLAASLGNPPVIVYNAQGSHDAQKVLKWASHQHVRMAVVVLVEKSDFAEYQACMHGGAAAYYEVSAEPERIAQIIRRADGNSDDVDA
jgi:DNA-binding NarL/FixJ family response regulator